MLPTYAYGLSEGAEVRCDKDEFYLQNAPDYKGYTEKIFRLLRISEPLTIGEIHKASGIPKRSINGVLAFNIRTGYILQYEIPPERVPPTIWELNFMYQRSLIQQLR